MLAFLIQIDGVQNLVVRNITGRLSSTLRTTVKIDHVSIGFFNRLHVDGALVLDQRKDTLLYAGRVRFRITDWFFLRDKPVIQYIGLENTSIYLNRTDSVWNYTFLADAFRSSSPPKKDTTPPPSFDLQEIELKNIRFSYLDRWIGEDMQLTLGNLHLQANELDLKNKRINLQSVELDRPAFTLVDYTGNRPDSLAPPKKLKPFVTGILKWNPEHWFLNLKELELNEGKVSFQQKDNRVYLSHFDPAHIEFSGITGTMKDLTFLEDTLSARIQLKTTERSGFTVNQLKANMSFDPEAMTFKDLDLVTPYSQLGNYYVMRYDRFKTDMNDFISKVRLEMQLTNSRVSTRDIAYFAPELSGWDKELTISGSALGTIEDFNTRNLVVNYGKDTRLSGDLSMKGLPDMKITRINFQNAQFTTSYTDAQTLYPSLKTVSGVNLNLLSPIRFTGNMEGTIYEFSTRGIFLSSLGQLSADLRFRLPDKGNASYEGSIGADQFQLGRLLGQESLGKISFSSKINGERFDARGKLILEADLGQLEFNRYSYRDLKIRGSWSDNRLTTHLSSTDPNAKLTAEGILSMVQSQKPSLNLSVQVDRADLQRLGFSASTFLVNGKGRMNVMGQSLDDFIGEASLSQVTLIRNGDVFPIDTLSMFSMNIEDRRHIELRNDDLSLILDGRFQLSTLSASISHYLSRYYPMYFTQQSSPVAPQDLMVKVDLKNIDRYVRIFDPKLSGFDFSSVNATFETTRQKFQIAVDIPLARYGKYRMDDFRFRSEANDTLRVTASAGSVVVNDSLQLPNATINLLASNGVSDLLVNTATNKTINAANLSATIRHMTDGFSIGFRPSSIVVNDKTWRIDKGGELTISRSVVDASEIRIYNGEQQFLISSIPSEIGNSHDIIVEMRRVNLGDILPYVLQEPRIQGITSGEITIEDPLNKFKVYVNAQTDQTRFENDSIGITTLNGYYDKQLGKVSFNLQSDNPGYAFLIDGKIDIPDSADATIDAYIDLKETKISVLQTYLTDIFSRMDGQATGRIQVQGPASAPNLLGTISVTNAGVEVGYTKVYYKLEDAKIRFSEGELNLGTIRITDPLGNRGTVSGWMKHRFFQNMEYDFRASSNKILALNTTKVDNDLFHGKAIARVNFRFSGPEDNMRLYINGAAVDSSRITIETSASASKHSGEVEYIRWRQYGREMNPDSISRERSNLTMDLDLAASPVLKMTVVLDPLTGDSITATGSGSLKILTGTREALTMNGRYNIESGAYNFNFQDIFNKPFVIEQNSGSYLSWTGDPYNAEINIFAKYVAEKVRMSTLFETGNNAGVSTVNSDVLREISDVWVNCNLTGTLNAPITSFQLLLPANSAVKNNPTIDNKIKTINRDQNEVSKQATYLIVFKSFAPQAAIVTGDLNQELLNNTISGVINSILSNSVQNFFSRLFGSALDVNFNYSRVATNLAGTQGTSTSQNQNTRENVSLEFIKSLVNNRLVITFGSDFNFNAVGNTAISNQNFLFLPDVNVEYKITPDGKFRTSFFYRSSFDVLSSSGRRERTGGNLSFRAEFDRLFGKEKK